MIELFKNFSVEQVIIFTVLLALAVKGLVSFIDWIKERNKKAFTQAQRPVELEHNVQTHDEQIAKLQKTIQTLVDNVNLLIESDKDDIKAFITRQHHYFCYQKKWIDDYSLDCVERRYEHYEAEGGNSFIETLMDELRALPKQPIEEKGGE